MKEQRRKKTYKNKLWFGTHISQYRTEKLLRCFANEVSAETAATECGVSHVTAKKAFNEFRHALFYAALTYPLLFNSAGVLILLGVPPNFAEFQAAASKRRKRRVKWNDVYVWEEIIRAYAGHKFTEAEIAIVLGFGFVQLARLNGIELTQHKEQLQPAGWMLPVEKKQEMNDKEFEGFAASVRTPEHVRYLWKAGIEDSFVAPPIVWTFFFTKRQIEPSHNTIYRDLRWYLLKHPIAAKRMTISRYWDDLPAPTLSDVMESRDRLFRNLKNGKR